MTMLQHTESLQQIYDKTQFTKNCMRKLRVKHKCSNYFDFSLVYNFHIMP